MKKFYDDLTFKFVILFYILGVYNENIIDDHMLSQADIKKKKVSCQELPQFGPYFMKKYLDCCMAFSEENKIDCMLMSYFPKVSTMKMFINLTETDFAKFSWNRVMENI